MVGTSSKKLVLRFPRHLVNFPVLSQVVKRHDLDFNILKAYVTPREEGTMVLEIGGREGAVDRAVADFESLGVVVGPLAGAIVRDEVRCTHCGACTAVCPTDALRIDRATAKVTFEMDKCIACGLCLPACPVRVMEEKLP